MCTNGRHVIDEEHFLKMKEDAIICNMGEWTAEINTEWLMDNCERDIIKPQVGNLMNLCKMKRSLHNPYPRVLYLPEPHGPPSQQTIVLIT